MAEFVLERGEAVALDRAYFDVHEQCGGRAQVSSRLAKRRHLNAVPHFEVAMGSTWPARIRWASIGDFITHRKPACVLLSSPRTGVVGM